MKLKLKINVLAIFAAAVSSLVTIIAYKSGVDLQIVPAEIISKMHPQYIALVAPIFTYFWMDNNTPSDETFKVLLARYAFGGIFCGLIIFIFASLIFFKI